MSQDNRENLWLDDYIAVPLVGQSGLWELVGIGDGGEQWDESPAEDKLRNKQDLDRRLFLEGVGTCLVPPTIARPEGQLFVCASKKQLGDLLGQGKKRERLISIRNKSRSQEVDPA